MAALQVKPTRMELSNLKKKKKVAVRGHKLMKDKRDEMVRRFIIYVRRNKELREQVEELNNQIEQAEDAYDLAKAAELKYGKLPEVKKQLEAAEQQAQQQ